MKETCIDHIDNISYIRGFVSSDDYLALDSVREYAKEHGIKIRNLKEKEPEDGKKRKKNKNKDAE